MTAYAQETVIPPGPQSWPCEQHAALAIAAEPACGDTGIARFGGALTERLGVTGTSVALTALGVVSIRRLSVWRQAVPGLPS
jgi:hypothetical protein